MVGNAALFIVGGLLTESGKISHVRTASLRIRAGRDFDDIGEVVFCCLFQNKG
jgi:hypothetical protein